MERLLSYGDVLLRKADLNLLLGPLWLNDNIIEFYFEFLRREGLNDADDLALIGPSMTFLVLQSNKLLVKEILEPLNLKHKNVRYD